MWKVEVVSFSGGKNEVAGFCSRFVWMCLLEAASWSCLKMPLVAPACRLADNVPLTLSLHIIEGKGLKNIDGHHSNSPWVKVGCRMCFYLFSFRIFGGIVVELVPQFNFSTWTVQSYDRVHSCFWDAREYIWRDMKTVKMFAFEVLFKAARNLSN